MSSVVPLSLVLPQPKLRAWLNARSVCIASCKGKYLSSKYIINGLSFDIYTFPMLVCLCVRMQDLDTHLIFRCNDFVLCPPALNVFLLDYSRAILVGSAHIILVVLS